MLVSIYCITYNHEKYISQAIESFLMQQTNFDYEIIIGEDCSTDNTATIVKEYAEKFPNKIKARCNEVNIGMHANSLKTLQECTGKYIAKCEGDDYWTDPLKLQKQVDFLEKNPDFSVCFHLSKTWSEKEQCFYDQDISNTIPEVTDIYRLANGHYVATQTVMYRRIDSAINELAFIKSPMTDYPFCMLEAKHGKIKLIYETMSVYRIHDGGFYQGTINYNNLTQGLYMLKSMFPYFANDIVHLLHLQYFRISNQVFEHYLKFGKDADAQAIIRNEFNINPVLASEKVWAKISKLTADLASLNKSKILKTYNIFTGPFKYFLKKGNKQD